MTPGNRAQQAILLEASSIKAGNVHPRASFADMTFEHFERAAEAIGKRLDQTIAMPVGIAIESCVEAMIESAGVNASLGTLLLIVPLSRLGNQQILEQSTFQREIQNVLDRLDRYDSEAMYAAIRKAKPGGLGTSEEMDVHQAPPADILDAMKLASQWDDVALQYNDQFHEVWQYADRLNALSSQGLEIHEAIRCLQIEIMASRPDSLIARKQGREHATHVQRLATEVLKSGPYASSVYESEWKRLDTTLRDPRLPSNPGTTADLIAAAVFVTLA